VRGKETLGFGGGGGGDDDGGSGGVFKKKSHNNCENMIVQLLATLANYFFPLMMWTKECL
jgi:hypothetical protein